MMTWNKWIVITLVTPAMALIASVLWLKMVDFRRRQLTERSTSGQVMSAMTFLKYSGSLFILAVGVAAFLSGITHMPK